MKSLKISVGNQHTSHLSVLIIMQVFWHADTVANMNAFAVAEIVEIPILSLTVIIGQNMRRGARRKLRDIESLSYPGFLGYLGWLS